MVPPIPACPNTADNSDSKYTSTFSNPFKNWELTAQYAWGIIRIGITSEAQFIDTPTPKKIIAGSNEENRFVIKWSEKRELKN